MGWGEGGRGAAHIRAWWRVRPSSSISSISSCPPPGCIAEPSRGASGGEPSSMGGVSFCSRSPPSGIAAPSRSRAAPSRVARGGGTAGEGGGAGGDGDYVAIGRRRVLFASALGFRPFLLYACPPLARVSELSADQATRDRQSTWVCSVREIATSRALTSANTELRIQRRRRLRFTSSS